MGRRTGQKIAWRGMAPWMIIAHASVIIYGGMLKSVEGEWLFGRAPLAPPLATSTRLATTS